jgi:hypothetical protein
MNIATQSAIFFNVFVNPIALESIAWKYYIVYVGLLILITATVYFFYPETNGHTLEEMARVFDGADAVVSSPARSEVLEIDEKIGKDMHKEQV